jgi:hypothetical protein
VKYEVDRGHEFFNESGIADIALVDFHLVFDVGDVGGRAGGHVVEDRDLVALGKQCITEVRTDKTGSTGDENAHEVKSIGKAGTALKSAQGFAFLWLMSAGRDILKL